MTAIMSVLGKLTVFGETKGTIVGRFFAHNVIICTEFFSLRFLKFGNERLKAVSEHFFSEYSTHATKVLPNYFSYRVITGRSYCLLPTNFSR